MIRLDPQGTEEVFETIKLMKDNNKTIILVEHKIDLICEYTDRVLLLHDGKIVKDGTTAVVLTDREVLDYGINLPQVANLGIALEEQTALKLERIPTTLQDAVEVFKKTL